MICVNTQKHCFFYVFTYRPFTNHLLLLNLDDHFRILLVTITYFTSVQHAGEMETEHIYYAAWVTGCQYFCIGDYSHSEESKKWYDSLVSGPYVISHGLYSTSMVNNYSTTQKNNIEALMQWYFPLQCQDA